MDSLVEIPLGPAGLEYLKSCLSQGGGLSELMQERVARDGEAFALVPAETEQDRLEKFNEGGLMSRSSMKAYLLSFVQKELSANPDLSFIVQDIWSDPSDPRDFQTGKVNVFFSYPLGVYFSVESKNACSDNILKCIDSSSSFLFISVISELSWQDSMLSSIVSVDFLNSVAEKTTHLFVSAYDQEGLVIWRAN